MNFKDPAKYTKEVMNDKLPIDHGEKLSLRKRMIETIILGLRTKDGVSYKKYKTRFKVNLNDIFAKQINKLVSLGLLKKDDCKIKLTKRGIFLANTAFREFVDWIFQNILTNRFYGDILFRVISTLPMRVLKEVWNGIRRKNENYISSFSA